MNNEFNETVNPDTGQQEAAAQESFLSEAAVQESSVGKAAAQEKTVIPHKKKVMEYTEYGDSRKRPTWIRVICIIAAVLLVGLIIATLAAAIAGARGEIVMALLLCDVIIPVFIWVFLKITQRSIDRRKEAEKYYGQDQN